MIGPPPLSAFTDNQGRRIDHSILQPAEKSPLAYRKESRHGCVVEAVSCCQIHNHAFKRHRITDTWTSKLNLVTKSILDSLSDIYVATGLSSERPEKR